MGNAANTSQYNNMFNSSGMNLGTYNPFNSMGNNSNNNNGGLKNSYNLG